MADIEISNPYGLHKTLVELKHGARLEASFKKGELFCSKMQLYLYVLQLVKESLLMVAKFKEGKEAFENIRSYLQLVKPYVESNMLPKTFEPFDPNGILGRENHSDEEKEQFVANCRAINVAGNSIDSIRKMLL